MHTQIDGDTRSGSISANALQPDLSERVRTALTALRSSAELLRDYPDIAAEGRSQLVEIVLAEEQRLERLLSQTLAR